jgi:hypothetical protein
MTGLIIIQIVLLVAICAVLVVVGAVVIYWVATVIVSVGNEFAQWWSTRHERREARHQRREASKRAKDYNTWFRANARWYEWYDAQGHPRGGWQVEPPEPWSRPVRREDYSSEVNPWEDSWNARVTPYRPAPPQEAEDG